MALVYSYMKSVGEITSVVERCAVMTAQMRYIVLSSSLFNSRPPVGLVELRMSIELTSILFQLSF